jgi:hypothetical protein
MNQTNGSTVEIGQYTGFVRRVLRAYARRVGDGELNALADLAALSAEVDGHLATAVARLRAEPWNCSWEQIADELGVTRQAAQARFRDASGTRRPGGQPANLR